MRKTKRVFAHYILYNGEIYKNNILEVRENYDVVLMPFEQEIDNTIFISGVVVVCNEDVINKHRCELSTIINSNQKLDEKAEKINHYLKSNDLYRPYNYNSVLFCTDSNSVLKL